MRIAPINPFRLKVNFKNSQPLKPLTPPEKPKPEEPKPEEKNK